SKAIVVGSGAGGSIAAKVLAERGWDVVVFEKGPNYVGDLREAAPHSRFSNDELKSRHRGFEDPDVLSEPRTYRKHSSQQDPLAVGDVNDLPSTVGGGTIHWDAKTPRMWDIDFKKRSLMGPAQPASVQDWPFAYQDLVPFYEDVERLIGVQGDVAQLPAEPTLKHAPRGSSYQYPMPPGPPQYGSLKLAAGAEALGLHPYPTPMAINSQTHGGRPACNDCGFCSGYGCPIHARAGALAPLRRAVRAGAEVRPNSFVFRVNRHHHRATGVSFAGPDGRHRTESADLVVLAGSAIETIRLALLSRFPNKHQLIGHYFMMHWFTTGFASFFTERMHAYRGRSTSHNLDDFADPEYPGASAAAQQAGLPYIRGGVVEMGGSQDVIEEAFTYKGLLEQATPEKPFGSQFKKMMRASVLRDRLVGAEMIAEDLAYRRNFVDLDPKVRDANGFPVARITYAPGNHELTAQRFYVEELTKLMKASGADVTAAVANTSSNSFPIGQGDVPGGAHIMGGMPMGEGPRRFVCDPHGRVHGLDNVFVTDGSVFVTSGAMNPTLTIMAVALRTARHFA
ncbi:MAG: GMC family oxidoreductase, partial [Actinobacteria bacterium]|nr:GMC family oxidoreductase [Actinomycetota bacterium]